MKIFLYGGSFDPVHLGHEKIINNSLSSCDKLFIIPANKSPHKKNNPEASSLHRYSMLSLLYKTNKKIVLSKYEIDKDDLSFTFNTIEYIKSKYKDAEITFILGSDLIKTLPDWYNIEKIQREVSFLIYNRNGFKEKLSKNFNLKYIQNFNENISSTNLKQLLQKGEFISVKKMLSPLIYNYIIKKDLYK